MFKSKYLSRAGVLAMLTLTPLFGGCGDSPTHPGPTQVVGTYSLVEINGEPLPVLFHRDAFYDTEWHYVAGDLALNADSTFALSYTIRVTKGTQGGRTAVGAESVYRASGTFGVHGDSIPYRITVFEGQDFDATVAGRVLDATHVTMPTHVTSHVGTYRKQ